jgi:biopolymer transport protein ExbD
MAMQMESGSTRFEINITPYIDVLLVLLITFMLMAKRMAIVANIAQESPAQNQPQEISNIVLELSDDGRYLINTREVARADLGARLREIMAPRRDRVLFIKSGGQRLYRETIEAMDIAKGAGVEVIALAP